MKCNEIETCKPCRPSEQCFVLRFLSDEFQQQCLIRLAVKCKLLNKKSCSRYIYIYFFFVLQIIQLRSVWYLSAIYNRVIMPFDEFCLNARFSSCIITDEVPCISHQLGSLHLKNVKIYIQTPPKVFNLYLCYCISNFIIYQLRLVCEYYVISIKANAPIVTRDF